MRVNTFYDLFPAFPSHLCCVAAQQRMQQSCLQPVKDPAACNRLPLHDSHFIQSTVPHSFLTFAMSCPYAGAAGATLADFAEPSESVPLEQRPAGRICRAREIINRAEAKGPTTGWRDGWLTMEHGFMEPPMAGASMLALRRTAGATWIETSGQLPSLVAHLAIRLRVSEMATISGDEATIPSTALVAADVTLSTLAAAYSWEWRRANLGESWALDHLPEAVLHPWKQICERLGMPGVGLTFTALIGGRYSVIDPTAWSPEEPYPERLENVAIEPAVFGSREEHVFLGVIVESLAIFKNGLRAMVAAQQAVLDDDASSCFDALREVKKCADRLVYAFHKISPNPTNGAYYVDPIVWGKTVAPLNSPINPDIKSPGGSGL